MSEEIVSPRKGSRDPELGPVAVMVAMEKDLILIRQAMGVRGMPVSKIMTSKLYTAAYPYQGVSVVGPMLGAPQAVMVLEKLVVLGARKILFLGWCGSVQNGIGIGDFVVVDRALVGEGTSQYYGSRGEVAKASKRLSASIEKSLVAHAVSFHKGLVWSTDAPYRETRQKVLSLQQNGVLGVDMEASALFSAARFRQVEMAALLVVSDELGSLRWKPGFSSGKFKRARRMAADIMCDTTRKL
ncbi:MAG: nucleoside phosphorylase [Deltaproteobacteria bacterium]|jgi:uridine phosphorylase